MDLYVKAINRGFPYLFASKAEFDEFRSILKEELESINLPSMDVRLQGSAVRSEGAEDLDLSVMLSKQEMDEAIKNAYRKSVTKNGETIDISDYSEKQLMELQKEIEADQAREIFNAKGRDFADTFKNRRLWPDLYPGLTAVKNKLKAKYGKLNITIQEINSTKNLKPFMKL